MSIEGGLGTGKKNRHADYGRIILQKAQNGRFWCKNETFSRKNKNKKITGSDGVHVFADGHTILSY